jgi:hypothetical protein
MVPLGEKNKEANKEDNKVFEFPLIRKCKQKTINGNTAEK